MQTSLNKYLNQKGDALVMALMVALGVGALSIVFLQRVKTQQRLSIKYQTDSEIDVATLDITSHLLNPKNCNATFTGKAVPATANDTTANQFGGTSFPAGTGIYSCTTGSCLTSTGRVVVKPILTNTDDVWASAHTGFPGAGSTASSKIRITGIKYWLNKDQTHHTGAAKGAPAIIRLQINFQKHLGYTTAPHPTIPGQTVTELKTASVVRDIFVPVVRGTTSWTTDPGYFPSSTILGCSRSPNSTILYSGL